MLYANRHTSRRGCAAGQLGLGLFAFFFTANLRLKENGMGKITLVYPAAPVTTSEVERRRYDSETTKATGLRIDRGVARVRVVFADVSRLSEAPEFRNTTFQIEPGDEGTFRLRAQVRATVQGDVISDRLAQIRVTLPGPIVASNAQTSAGAVASWAGPVTQYFSRDGIELDATYRTKPVPASDPQRQALNTTKGDEP